MKFGTLYAMPNVLSKDPCNLFGYRHLDFDMDVHYDELLSSEESGLDASKAAKASGSSRTVSKSQAKGRKRISYAGHTLSKNAIVGSGPECFKADRNAR